ncbi:MAG: glutamate--tRNA ligase [Azospirillaceae bacterium]|nr:glutamate--tRNA ligase [Azospirillaceae bacterium]
MKVRTRVAPSPTGDPHVGTAYMALMNYCFAKGQGGDFILRIEDTDRARSTAASERMILESLRWLGLTWDEGPDVGGVYGPYRQSERSAIYQTHAQVLLDRGHAFKCFCTAERLDQMRLEQKLRGQRSAYDGHCLHLSSSEVAQLEAEGRPHVVRMKVPASGTATIHDLRRGDIQIDWDTVDMQVLMKSDGLPTYHLANVVDDHLMKITHVLRGEEWVSSAPKHQLLYQYFEWDMPALCHLPLLRNPDRTKLSKRKNPTSIVWYQRMGYLPEALLNLLGLFAVSSSEGDEMHRLEDLVRIFDVQNISLGGPVFDITKLNWLNGRYIRETLDPEGFAARVRDWALNPEYLMKIAALAQTRVERLSDLGPLTSFFFSGNLDLTPEALRNHKVKPEDLRKVFQLAIWGFDALAEWNLPPLERVLRDVAERTGYKFRDFVRPFFIAITGTPASVPLFDAMALLGRDLVRERLRQAITKLGGVTAAEAKEWKKLAEPEAAGEAEA